MIIVFDTETTGLPKNYAGRVEDLDNWPRIIQLAYSVYDRSGKEMKRFCKLIKPEGWTMPTGSFHVNNGFSQEKSEAEGIPIKEALDEFVKDRINSSFSVAHNMSFDSKVIRSEMIRAGINQEFTSKKICTMKSTISFCNLPNTRTGRGKKFPSLTELHNKLFSCSFSGAHDAGADVAACAKCFFELVRTKAIDLDKFRG